MKRLFLILSILFVVSLVNASDMADSLIFTVPSNYFNYYLPPCNDSVGIYLHDSSLINLSFCAGGKNYASGSGQGFYTSDAIKVKGVAIGGVYWKSERYATSDTNIDYDLDVSVLKLIDENTVEYYAHAPLNTMHDVCTDTIFISKDTVLLHSIPVYDVFFDSAVFVSDTFFCMVDALFDGKNDSTFFDDKAFYLYDIQLLCDYADRTCWLDEIPYITYLYHALLTTGNIFFNDEWAVRHLHIVVARHSLLIFPILDLGDSTGVAEADAVGRNAAVWPNPARGTVSVASGFGLRNIDVFDIEGRLVLSRKVSGLSADIDISALPRGAYAVRITTMVGTTTKKLLVE